MKAVSRVIRSLAPLLLIGSGLTVGLTAGLNLAAITPASATIAPWSTVATFGPVPSTHILACPTASACYAAGQSSGGGSDIEETQNGGLSWFPQTPPDATSYYQGAACASTSTCFLAGVDDASVTPVGVLAETNNSGSTWTNATLPVSTGELRAATCPSSTTCYVVGDAGTVPVAFVTTNGGSTWTAGTMPAMTFAALSMVTCPSTSTCYASDGYVILKTTDTGVTWTTQNSSVDTELSVKFSALSCPTATACDGIGIDSSFHTTLYLSTNSATTFASGGPAPGTNLWCSSASSCVDYDSNLFSTTTNATTSTMTPTTWSGTSLPSNVNFVEQYACSTITSCQGVGINSDAEALYVSTSDGSTWTTDSIPSNQPPPVINQPPLSNLTCVPRTETCMATSDNSFLAPSVCGPSACEPDNPIEYAQPMMSTDGGATWTEKPLPSGDTFTAGLACPAAADCYASAQVGVNDVIYSSSNGGSTWTAGTVPTSNTPGPIACDSATDCYSISGDTLLHTSNGSTWTTTPTPFATANFTPLAISCPASGTCYVAGHTNTASLVYATNDSWVTWSDPAMPSSAPTSVSSITCPSATVCYVSGVFQGVSPTAAYPAGAVTTDGGSTWTALWTAATIPSGLGGTDTNTGLVGIGCVSTTICHAAASGGAMVYTADSGSTWTTEPMPNTPASLNDITCPEVTIGCVATGSQMNGAGSLVFDSPPPAIASTSAGVSPGAVADHASVTYSATVTSFGNTGTPTGTVTFSVGSTIVCGGPQTLSPASSSSSSASCGATNAPVGENQTVVASYSGSDVYVSSLGETTLSVAPANPAPPAGANGSASAASGPSGNATATTGGVTGSGAGYGSLTVASYGSNPTGTSVTDGTGTYYDVKVSSGSAFTSVTITVCNPGAANSLSWFNGTSWVPFSNQTMSGGCLVATVTNSTIPTIAQLTGTPIALVDIPANPPPPPRPQHGYWLEGSDGGIFSFGSAQFYGSMGGITLQRPVVGIVPTADRGGYWLDASDGGVFSFGDTQFFGSIPGLGLNPAGSGKPHSLNAPIVGMVPSHDDGGYFMVASDGGVFAFGDAHFAGSCPGIGGCSGAGVAVMPDASGNGYWLVTSTGNVYTFGDAPYFGAPGKQPLPITSAVATPDGHGYWILDGDGQVFAYGSAANLGSPDSSNFNGLNPAEAVFTTSDGAGYWVADAQGKVFNFGDAPNDGDMSGTHLNGAIIAASGS